MSLFSLPDFPVFPLTFDDVARADLSTHVKLLTCSACTLSAFSVPANYCLSCGSTNGVDFQMVKPKEATMAKFKVGDRVRCIEDSGMSHLVRKGGEYTVARSAGMSVDIQEVGDVYGFQDDRFELVEAAKPTEDPPPPVRIFDLTTMPNKSSITTPFEVDEVTIAGKPWRPASEIEAERQRANRLGDEAGKWRAIAETYDRGDAARVEKIRDLESQARSDARTIAAYKERVRRLERR